MLRPNTDVRVFNPGQLFMFSSDATSSACYDTAVACFITPVIIFSIFVNTLSRASLEIRDTSLDKSC
ncbi:hypothetical protein Barb7_01761 [Bacteroidales bacterium Barb7]|nr:hypothetical protein Barb7_01761 [Bacteroidales bacterium Barb7]